MTSDTGETPANAAAADDGPGPALGQGGSSLTERAYLQLEHMIVTGELPPGSWISEAALSQQVGIGRTPVREALQRLANEHLVSIIPRRGIFVTEINIQNQFLQLEVRRDLERLMAVRAARHSTSAERVKLTELADAMMAAIDAGEYKRSIRMGRDCSLLVRRCSRNPYAERAVAPLYSASRRFFYLHAYPEDVAASARYHAELVRAVVLRDPDAAAEAANDLMNFLEAFARTVIDESRPPQAGDFVS